MSRAKTSPWTPQERAVLMAVHPGEGFDGGVEALRASLGDALAIRDAARAFERAAREVAT